MKPDSEKVKDPVCHMWVAPHQYAINDQGMDFAFCSQQCQDRFLANPHLYIGVPGEPAPKQQGQDVVKQRRLRLDQALSAAAAGAKGCAEHLSITSKRPRCRAGRCSPARMGMGVITMAEADAVRVTSYRAWGAGS